MKLGKIVLLSVVVLLMASVMGCTNAKAKDKDRNEKMVTTNERLVQDGETVNAIQTTQSMEFYEAQAFGGPSPEAATMAAKKQTSLEAAKLSALNDIATYLYGVKLESGMTVKDAALKDSNISAEVTVFIRGAEVIKKEWDDEGGCSVVMRINMKDFKERLKAIGIR